MKINDKKKLLRYLWFYKHLFFVKYETDNPELLSFIHALNIKSRYKRIDYVYDEICNEIDQYYSSCSLCNFKNGKCVSYRTQNLNYINGCCRKCLYQSDKGCTTKNIACKLFLCSYADHKNKKKLEGKDLSFFKFFNPYQKYVAINDYFSTKEQVVWDLYVGPICLIVRLLIRGLLYIFKRKEI